MVFADPNQLNKQSSPADSAFRMGKMKAGQGDFAGAITHYEYAINEDPQHHQAFAAGGEAFVKLKQYLPAADCFACAIKIKPDSLYYKRRFIFAVEGFKLTQHNDNIADIALKCLTTPNLNHMDLRTLWMSYLELNKDFSKLCDAASRGDYTQFKTQCAAFNDQSFIVDDLFIEGLKRIVVPNMRFEKCLTALRRSLLEMKINISAKHQKRLKAALAHYCHRVDYIFNITDDEQTLLDNCKDQLLKACYARPKTSTGDEQTDALLITQAQELTKIADNIEAIVPIKNNISKNVQAMYEAYPYPRWGSFDEHIKDEGIEGALIGKEAQILVAGCGTGQEAIELAHVFPNAKILAIDLSRQSLAYGIYKANALGIKNITFKHGDILALGTLEALKGKFDYIASSGVLHHMQDPLEGWRVLETLLKPRGLMRIALYSEIAREGIAQARTAIKSHDLKPNDNDIRYFRKNAQTLVGSETQAYLQKFRDYYYMPECCDLIFHVQEHRFTLPQIENALDTLGLDFLKFYLPVDDLQAYNEEFPNDNLARNLKNWDNFEHNNPRTFISMYRFWCRKS